MAPTQADIAKACGVSYTTVSFVLNDKAREMNISAAVIDKVKAAARRMGYTRNYHAATLATGKSHAIGLVIYSDLINPYWSTITEGIDKAAQQNRYDVLLMTDGPDERMPAKCLRFFRERRIDGMIVVGGYREYTIKAAQEQGFPLVAIEVTPKGLCPEIKFDSLPGIEAAVRHLYEKGHRHVLWVGLRRPDGTVVLPPRRERFHDTIRQLSMSAHEMILTQETAPGDYAGLLQMAYAQLSRRLTIDKKTTAVMCHNDIVALALNHVLAQRGVRVPGDLSLIGFDDLQAAYCVPALTTISHRLDEMGRRAAQVLLGLIKDRGADVPPACDPVVHAELVIRDSVAAVKTRRKAPA